MYTEEKKKKVLSILHTTASGNISECSRLAKVDRKIIQKWEKEYQAEKTERNTDQLPGISEMKEKILRRVNEIIETCPDPKKLMDTYEALTKFEKESDQRKESIFDIITRKLERD